MYHAPEGVARQFDEQNRQPVGGGCAARMAAGRALPFAIGHKTPSGYGAPAMNFHTVSIGRGLLAISELPGLRGNYTADLKAIRDWAPGLVVSLTTQTEMDEAGSADLGAHLAERGSRWVHLPITDFGTPTESVLTRWPEVSSKARAALAGGGRVLFHCRGGCGRSGMAALRVMIEAGEAPDAALTRLRAVRTCAVETDAQLAWAKAAIQGTDVFVRKPAAIITRRASDDKAATDKAG